MNRLLVLLVALSLAGGIALPAPVLGVGVVSSPHNLSTGAEQRVCIFCHTPHHATRLSDQLYPGPLWNRDEIVDPFYYTPYESSTLVATQGKAVTQPQGASRICLSCHDGTIALASASHGLAVNLPPLSGSAVLGRDLRYDHPVSVQYGAQPSEYQDPAVLNAGKVKLVNRSGVNYVECTSCHDPHDNQYGNFLVLDTSTQQDSLCSTCHIPNSWSGSAHQADATLSPKGCMNCHATHKAQQGENLLLIPGGGSNIDGSCTASCHNDISGRSVGVFNHGNNSDPAGNKHRGAENLALAATWGADPLPLGSPEKHVHCVDCHNPHQTGIAPITPPTPPEVTGVLKGVRGVDINGQPRTGATPYAQYEYEICFRCHSGDAALAGDYNAPDPVVRIFNSWDQRERFNWGTAKSWHPVGAPFTRVGSSQGLSLKDPGQRIIFCNDCHDPHGSTRTHLLREDNQDTFSPTQGISYPLCYKCHDENYLLTTSGNTRVLRLHKAHVLGVHQDGNNFKASCSNCHDPHGVPNKFGLTTETNSLHLINFDTRYAGVGSSYDATAGSCFIVAGTSVSCHPTTANPALFSAYDTYSP